MSLHFFKRLRKHRLKVPQEQIEAIADEIKRVDADHLSPEELRSICSRVGVESRDLGVAEMDTLEEVLNRE